LLGGQNSRVVNGELQANGGSVSALNLQLGNEDLNLLSGSSVSYNLNPNTGWENKEIEVNNVAKSFDNAAAGSGTLTISENTTIKAVFGSERVTLTHQPPGSGDEFYRINYINSRTYWNGSAYQYNTGTFSSSIRASTEFKRQAKVRIYPGQLAFDRAVDKFYVNGSETSFTGTYETLTLTDDTTVKLTYKKATPEGTYIQMRLPYNSALGVREYKINGMSGTADTYYLEDDGKVWIDTRTDSSLYSNGGTNIQCDDQIQNNMDIEHE
jgi:hypothetical protein